MKYIIIATFLSLNLCMNGMNQASSSGTKHGTTSSSIPANSFLDHLKFLNKKSEEKEKKEQSTSTNNGMPLNDRLKQRVPNAQNLVSQAQAIENHIRSNHQSCNTPTTQTSSSITPVRVSLYKLKIEHLEKQNTELAKKLIATVAENKKLSALIETQSGMIKYLQLQSSK